MRVRIPRYFYSLDGKKFENGCDTREETLAYAIKAHNLKVNNKVIIGVGIWADSAVTYTVGENEDDGYF